MESKSMREHKKHSPLKVKVGIITLSDSKSNQQKSNNSDDTAIPKEDVSGKIIMESVEGEHEIVSYTIIPDDAELLLRNLNNMRNTGAQVIISTGGTGIGKRDITIETITPLFTKELKGFGEIFRYESYKELGTGAMLSRTTAGVWGETLLVALPGSPNAVKLGMRIIKPELGHLVKHMKN
jgi:molybdenum cofactor biosynthesis protein B